MTLRNALITILIGIVALTGGAGVIVAQGGPGEHTQDTPGPVADPDTDGAQGPPWTRAGFECNPTDSAGRGGPAFLCLARAAAQRCRLARPRNWDWRRTERAVDRPASPVGAKGRPGRAPASPATPAPMEGTEAPPGPAAASKPSPLTHRAGPKVRLGCVNRFAKLCRIADHKSRRAR